jgi:peroxiredoxin Q/BCP
MPAIGQTAPNFTLTNQDGQSVNLTDYRGKKVVIFAFPKANTGGCNAQACSFRDEFPRIEAGSAVVLGVSTDSPETLKKWKARLNLPYDLLSDPDMTMLQAWDARGSILGLINLPAASRSVWVLDENGVVLEAQVGIGPQASVDRALSVLAAQSA